MSDRLRSRTTGRAMYKAVLLGEYGVGKTTLFRCLRDGTCRKTSLTVSGDTPVSRGTSAVGMDKCSKRFTLEGGDNVVLDVWDTGGSERFRTLTRNYYNFASVIILVYDASKPSSLTNLVPWMEDARIYSPTAEFVLMGNVVSDEEESIDPTSVDAFAELHGIKAKCKIDIRSGESVHKAFELAASYIHRLKNRRYFEESGSVHLYTENVRLMPAKKNKCPSCCART